MMDFPCLPITFKSSRTKSLDAEHPVDAWLVDTQGAIAVSLEAGCSQGKGESSILEALPRIEANGWYEPALHGFAYDRVGRGRDRASKFRNCGDCENAGTQQKAATKRTATA